MPCNSYKSVIRLFIEQQDQILLVLNTIDSLIIQKFECYNKISFAEQKAAGLKTIFVITALLIFIAMQNLF
ncbi:hypothetical protein EB796_003667 [Bugula neritina]|uniref:Uncharacterized protein n=1 Tax=Bugula neritina TaxID=10212 RepID=A0A7J7KJC3_BUGNE|nr:hypothetical protein EB796_003667 [Bugula neritina]